jgi:predicted lysophospholipase L1 biosynthesis ABC-type transport system permease subunit
MTYAGFRRIVGNAGASEVYVRLEPGADRRAVLDALRPLVGERAFTVVESEKPSDILNFGRVQNLPQILAGIIAILAGATLAHTLVSAVRRRRRDLAVLKTLGFVRRQTLAVVLWQATTLASIAVLIGVPLGVALGRWAWALFADQTGVVREPVVPPWQIAVVVAGTLLLANVVAALPGRLAARTRPAEALRAE